MQVSFRTAIAMAAMFVADAQARVAGVYRSSPRPRKSTNQPAFHRRRSGKSYKLDSNGCGQREAMRVHRRAQGGPGIVFQNAFWRPRT